MLIDIIAGARPNFMKIAPIIHALQARERDGGRLRYRLVHTGQHYDARMSGDFFEQLGIPTPDVNLEVGSGTQAEQTAAIMTRYEKLLLEQPSTLCLVVGDVTSTMACAIAAQKLHVPVAHVEGGIRSGDWSMPEEINRMVTDAITNWFFTTSQEANENLRRTGVDDERIFFVGNTMIDTLLANMSRLRPPAFAAELGLQPGEYFVTTLHRPANVDAGDGFLRLLAAIGEGTRGLPVVFPVHPRTAKTLRQVAGPVQESDGRTRVDAAPDDGRAKAGVAHSSLADASLADARTAGAGQERPARQHQPAAGTALPANLHLVDPQPYLEFNWLVKHARAVITDSGGITEEATVMQVPCLTLRDTTERPETITLGTNELIGTDPAKLGPALDRLFAGQWKQGCIPPLWDGHTGERIVAALEGLLATWKS